MCCKQALSEDLSYVWVDTCCIDKRSSAELSEAINSMFRWYRDAEVCYAFLSDLAMGSDGSAAYNINDSLWFNRGWTLQELIAPRMVSFFDCEWAFIGSKESLHSDIVARTGIPLDALRNFKTQQHSLAQIMSWAAGRQITRVEDRSYSLLGLFEINMPLLYGEGDNAFVRLQEQLMSSSNDRSIFLFPGRCNPEIAMYAASPDSFEGLLEGIARCDCRLNFLLSKAGISGSFRLWNYAFDIYAAGMGSWQEEYALEEWLCIFVQWDSAADLHRRVIVDGTSHTSITGYKNNARQIQRDISIGRLPVRAVSSDYISTRRLKQYLPPGAACIATPAKSFLHRRQAHPPFRSSLSVQVGAYYSSIKFPLAQAILHHSREHTNWDDRPGDCLCIGEQDSSAAGSAVLLQHHVNSDNKPVVLLSSCSNAGRDIPRECEFRGYYWLPKKHGLGNVARQLQNLGRDQRSPSTNLDASPQKLSKAGAETRTTRVHRTIRIGDWVLVHFLQRQDNKKAWDVYYEFLAPRDLWGQQQPIDHREVPEGWKAISE